MIWPCAGRTRCALSSNSRRIGRFRGSFSSIFQMAWLRRSRSSALASWRLHLRDRSRSKEPASPPSHATLGEIGRRSAGRKILCRCGSEIEFGVALALARHPQCAEKHWNFQRVSVSTSRPQGKRDRRGYAGSSLRSEAATRTDAGARDRPVSGGRLARGGRPSGHDGRARDGFPTSSGHGVARHAAGANGAIVRVRRRDWWQRYQPMIPGQQRQCPNTVLR